MTRRARIDDLVTLAVPEQPVLSPDGTQIVYVLRTTDTAADRSLRSLWQVPVKDGVARQLTHGVADVAPSWAPDGSRLAFLRTMGDDTQVWVLPTAGGEAVAVTALPLGAGAPVWSPDGTRIAFVSAVDIAGHAEGDAPTGGSEAPLSSDRLAYHADGAGMLGTLRSHLHVVDVVTHECRQLTDGDWHAAAPAWSPDGARLAFTAARGADSDLTAHTGAYVLQVDDVKAVPVPVGLDNGLAATVTWTVEGDALLVVGHPGEPTGHARLLHVPLDGAAVTDLASSTDRNVMPGGPAYPGAVPALAHDGDTVLFCLRDRGCTHLYATTIDGTEPRPVLVGAGRNVSGVSVTGDVAALVLGTPTSFGEVIAVDLVTGHEEVRTRHGDTWDGIEIAVREPREFTISDGTVVQGWVLRDPQTTGAGPLLLDIHGGPHNAWNGAADDVHLYHQELIALGWTVLLVNVRGSDGYGEAFFNAGLAGWGVADAADFLEPVDTLVAEGLADPRRLAVTGYSYGGYMTCYLTSRDDRFAAAVAGGVVTDLTSFVGTSDTGHFLAVHEFGALPWDQPERYGAMSPISKVDDVHTPTLIVHGGSDLRCPVGQAQQWHTALRQRGVPTRLVLYPGGSHLFVIDGPPSHRMDFNHRVVDWVEQYAGDLAGPRRPRLDAAHWERRLQTLAAKHGVPGATLGILRVQPGREDDEVHAAHGVLNQDTGVSTTTDSVFQIGSISKVWTATVAMQLVEEGLLHLDEPVIADFPELRLGDADVAQAVTLRHLLTHTSGIDGDVFTDTGRGDDCLAAYADGLENVGQIHPLGATWSYCNSGYTLIGRLIEKATGLTWDRAVRDRLFTPLGLGHTMTLPEDALLHRTAVGHVSDGQGGLAVAPVWMLPRSMGPSGLICSTVEDVLSFARMHLLAGVGPNADRLLSEDAATAMTALQAEVPDKHTLGDSWGLGWIRFGWNGSRLVGHDGNTIGQAAFLRLLPEHGLAVTLLTNGGNATDLYQDLYREIFAALADVAMPLPLAPPAQPPTVDLARHAGTYEREGFVMDVVPGDQPVLRITVAGPLAELTPDASHVYALTAVDETGDLYAVRDEGAETWVPVTFFALTTGEPYLHFGARATPKAT